MRGSEEGCLAIDGLCTVRSILLADNTGIVGGTSTSTVLRVGLVLDHQMAVFDMLYKYRAAPGKASVPVDSPRSRGSGND